MPDKFHTISISHLLQLILNEFDTRGSIFGLPKELFFSPENNNSLRTELFRQKLHAPVGVAAGPHTQMAQNIIGAWLMGARYIELKTVQTLDEIEVSKPCIDMQDEGFNCEWSQELTIKESFNEYLNAWIIIHVLNHRFGWAKETGTIFNMSVGYDLKGIMNNNVQWFLAKMHECEDEIHVKIDEISNIYPGIIEVMIPSTLSDNITLSTMHGCPANEIEEIAKYLLEEKKLHTLVKLNPTLLGPEQLRSILNSELNFNTVVPDIAFDHDLRYPDAVKIIRSLQKVAENNNLQFGLKLTNTLESINDRDVFGSDVAMMYMSGRALHPISVNVAAKLQQDFKGALLLSFSAGASAFNISELISCGFKTVTVCSDILKPGGYLRLNQYFEELNASFIRMGADNINDFIIRSSDKTDLTPAALSNLSHYSNTVIHSKDYRRDYIKQPDIKTERKLGYFDCISAPCRDTCATNQDIPEYLYFTAAGQFDKAFEVILMTNPFPSVTGMVCDHLCQGKCTRVNFDDPVQIREVKRFISCQDEVKLKPAAINGIKVAIIGAGPSGLSCAYYLALAGFKVDMFESRSLAGGMIQFAIPGFRLTDKAIAKDIKRITDLGVIIHYDSKVDSEIFQSLREVYSYIFIGAGAQLSAALKIEGSASKGVLEPLQFLFSARKGQETGIGRNVVIIGGGNTAMDAARTAYRLVGDDGKVTVIYRRTVNEMPADQGEIKAVLDEGIEIIELTTPEKVLERDGKIIALLCNRMELRGVDKRGRPTPVKVEGSEFELPCDTIIPAIGQQTDIDFIAGELLSADTATYKTKLEKVFIGGDALRGASTAINAIGDGRKAAAGIIREAGIEFSINKPLKDKISRKELIIRRSKRLFAPKLNELSPENRRNFNLVSKPLEKDTIISEADRCLYCDEICNICTTVCPNFANHSYEIAPCRFNLQKAIMNEDGKIEIYEDKVFEIKQPYQILNIANFCNECGNCNTFCPTAGAPYKEKPKLYLTISSFNQAAEGYYLAKLKDRKNLILKQNDHITTLTELSDEYIYENDYVIGRFTREGFRLSEVRFKTPCIREAHFRMAAEMSILLKGADELVFV